MMKPEQQDVVADINEKLTDDMKESLLKISAAKLDSAVSRKRKKYFLYIAVIIEIIISISFIINACVSDFNYYLRNNILFAGSYMLFCAIVKFAILLKMSYASQPSIKSDNIILFWTFMVYLVAIQILSFVVGTEMLVGALFFVIMGIEVAMVAFTCLIGYFIEKCFPTFVEKLHEKKKSSNVLYNVLKTEEHFEANAISIQTSSKKGAKIQINEV